MQYFFYVMGFFLLCPFLSNATNIEVKVNNHAFSFSVNEKDISHIKKTIQSMADTLHVTGIISTVGAGIALLKNTYQRLTQSEKKLVKKCIMILVALWVVSTHVFWICMYAIGKFAYQFQDKTFRQKFFTSLQKTIAAISDKITVH